MRGAPVTLLRGHPGRLHRQSATMRPGIYVRRGRIWPVLLIAYTPPKP